MERKSKSLWDTKIVTRAAWDSLVKLNPRTLMKNPVMFVVEIGAALLTVTLVHDVMGHKAGFAFGLQITLWLWFTVVFANFAEAMAEGRGKAQADTLRKSRTETVARRLKSGSAIEQVSGSKLRTGDVVAVTAGEFIPGDGEVIEGVASVDESAITGESAPVIRESGGDRSAVTGGTRVLSDEIKVRITSNPGETFLDRMIKMVEGASRQKTPNEIALNILLSGLTIIFLLAVAALQPMAMYSGAPQSPFVLWSLLVCLIPTTIGGLLSAIGIAGMDRVIQRNVMAMSGRAVEAAGDVDTLLLDKTGTISAVVAGSYVRSVHRADAHVRSGFRRPRHSQRRGGSDQEIRGGKRRSVPGRGRRVRATHRQFRRDASLGRVGPQNSGRGAFEGHCERRYEGALRSPARDGNSHSNDYRR